MDGKAIIRSCKPFLALPWITLELWVSLCLTYGCRVRFLDESSGGQSDSAGSEALPESDPWTHETGSFPYRPPIPQATFARQLVGDAGAEPESPERHSPLEQRAPNTESEDEASRPAATARGLVKNVRSRLASTAAPAAASTITRARPVATPAASSATGSSIPASSSNMGREPAVPTSASASPRLVPQKSGVQ